MTDKYYLKVWREIQMMNANCMICGKEFAKDGWHPNQVTCGKQKCLARKWYIEHHDHVKTYMKDYREKKWFDNRRDEVIQRDGGKCVKCGGVKSISVHHKDGKGRGYQGKIDNSLDNLITLCNQCHQQTHRLEDAKFNKREYLLGVAKYWDKSDREIARALKISHPTVAAVRKLLALKIGIGGGPFPIDPASFPSLSRKAENK